MKWCFHLKHVEGTLELLGTIVGRDPERIESFLDNKFRSWAPTLDLLLAKRMPAQVSLLLARTIGCQRPIYDVRALPRDLTYTGASFLDDKVRNTVAKKLDLSSTTPSPATCSKLHFDKEAWASPRSRKSATPLSSPPCS
jgi:hypothetical protein